jgi:hypothetical protein
MGYTSIIFYQDFLVNAYFWILIGILYRLPSLALSAQFAVEARTSANRLLARRLSLPTAQAKS